MTRADAVEQLAASIAGLRPGHAARVAIDGVDGAGKTMLADELVEPLRRAGRQVVRASVDGFHNPRAVRYARGPDSAEGYFLDSFDYAALKRELLEPLGPTGDGSFRTVVFDYRTDRAVQAPRQVAPRDAVLLFDGVFLSRAELRGSWDMTVCMYLAQCRPLEQADIVFDNTVLDRPRVVTRDAG